MQEKWVRSLGWENPLDKGMATHSSILAWEMPWTEEPGGLQSVGSLRVRRDLVSKTMTTMVLTSSVFIYFLRNRHTVLHSGEPIYIPPNSAQGFTFLHIVTNICYL